MGSEYRPNMGSNHFQSLLLHQGLFRREHGEGIGKAIIASIERYSVDGCCELHPAESTCGDKECGYSAVFGFLASWRLE